MNTKHANDRAGAQARAQAKALVAKMTIEEKASQLRYNAPPVKRLGIPAFNWRNEALHGVASTGAATSFPQAVAMAASFDPELLLEIGDAIATEGRAKYNQAVKQNDRDIYKGLTFWSSAINIFCDPRWGRGHETYGEDPYLTASMGVSFVKGIQGNGEFLKAAAYAKHFAVCTGEKSLRHEFDAKVSKKDLYETYLPAFEAFVKETGVAAERGTYLYSLKAYQQGLVSEAEITAAAEQLFTTRFRLGLFEKTEFDKIPYTKVECKEHISLAEKMASESMVLLKNNGILPLKKEAIKTIGVIGPNADSRAALIGNYYGTSSSYITLLEGIREEAGEEIRVLYAQGTHLYKDRMEALARSNDRMSEAYAVADESDVVILCLGLDGTLEGEEGDAGNDYASGDKKDFSLPDVQKHLLEEMLARKKPVIVCILAGSAIDLSEAAKKAAAILQVWYPGARGGRQAAKILFGECSPSGKLPITFYKDLNGFPSVKGYSMTKRTYRYIKQEPLYPFGFGLTYGNIVAQEASISELRMEKRPEATVRVKLKNIGAMDAQDVVQIYVKNKDSKYAVPNYSLCAFQRIYLKKDESKTIEIKLSDNTFTVVNEEGQRIVDGERYDIFVGTSQPDKRSLALMKTKPIRLYIRLYM